MHHLQHLLRSFVLLAGACGTAASAPAQGLCGNLGNTPMPAAIEPSPLPLGCAFAPEWPMWHLLTPPHRAPTPMAGFQPGDARALPRVLIAYRCTGFLLLPAVPHRVRTMGYVIDQPAAPCVPPPTTP